MCTLGKCVVISNWILNTPSLQSNQNRPIRWCKHCMRQQRPISFLVQEKKNWAAKNMQFCRTNYHKRAIAIAITTVVIREWNVRFWVKQFSDRFNIFRWNTLISFVAERVAQFHGHKIQYFIQIIFWIALIKISHFAYTYKNKRQKKKKKTERWHRSICGSNYCKAFLIYLIFDIFHWNWRLTIQREIGLKMIFNRKSQRTIKCSYRPHCCGRYLMN